MAFTALLLLTSFTLTLAVPLDTKDPHEIKAEFQESGEQPIVDTTENNLEGNDIVTLSQVTNEPPIVNMTTNDFSGEEHLMRVDLYPDYTFSEEEVAEGENTGVGEEGDLFEGDIMLNDAQREAIYNRKAIKFDNRRWPNGQVFVKIESSSAADRKAIINAAIHWMNKTNDCLTFYWATSTTKNYISFFKGSGCYSYIGKIGGGQVISVGRGCAKMAIIAHEIGHAIGFFHEQSRGDRDKYIRIVTKNIQSGREGNFANNGRFINNYNLAYDFGSLMHYGSYGFSKNGKRTIVTIDPSKQNLIGQRRGLSVLDAQLAKRMYGCR